MAMRMLIAVVVLVAAPACKKKGGVESKEAAVAHGSTFSIPVPAGYSVVTDQRLTEMAPGGAALIAKKRVKPKGFIGSIVVTKIPDIPSSTNPSTQPVCQQTAAAIAQAHKLTLDGAKMVKSALGMSCQWQLTAPAPQQRRAIGTVMFKSRANAWVVTCNFDARDQGAVAACSQVVENFSFK